MTYPAYVPDHLSASQINLYLQCSLKYRFRYVDNLPKPFKPAALAFGSAVHSSLEWFHKERLKGNARSLDEFLAILGADWYSQIVETDLRYKNGDSESSLLSLGKQLLTQYFHAYEGTPAEAEVPFHLPLVDPVTGEVLRPMLMGFVDLVEEPDVIVEFKTSLRTLTAQTINQSLQLTCYSYAYEMLFQKPPSQIKVVNLVKSRSPKIVALEATRSQDDYRRLFHTAKAVVQGIRAGIFMPKPNFMCNDCEYAGPCDQWPANDQ